MSILQGVSTNIASGSEHPNHDFLGAAATPLAGWLDGVEVAGFVLVIVTTTMVGVTGLVTSVVGLLVVADKIVEVTTVSDTVDDELVVEVVAATC